MQQAAEQVTVTPEVEHRPVVAAKMCWGIKSIGGVLAVYDMLGERVDVVEQAKGLLREKDMPEPEIRQVMASEPVRAVISQSH